MSVAADPVVSYRRPEPPMSGMTPETEQVDKVRVTATDLATRDSGSQDIWDDYCIVAAGGCEVTYINVTTCKDGSETHVLTVKGVRRG